MDAGISYLSASSLLDTRPPMLVVGASAAARERALRGMEDAGWRSAAFPIDGAIDRLAQQASASGLWIELDGDDEGEALDRLLMHANHEAAVGRLPTIVAAPAGLIDLVAARLDAESTQLLVDPGPVERVTALALAGASAGLPAMLHDVAREPASRRLKQLSDEVGRIAATLARLSTGPYVPSKTVERPGATSDIPPVSGEAVRNVIRARRLRALFR